MKATDSVSRMSVRGAPLVWARRISYATPSLNAAIVYWWIAPSRATSGYAGSALLLQQRGGGGLVAREDGGAKFEPELERVEQALVAAGVLAPVGLDLLGRHLVRAR